VRKNLRSSKKILEKLVKIDSMPHGEISMVKTVKLLDPNHHVFVDTDIKNISLIISKKERLIVEH
jgi:hypothetical protein